jgi:hypothetical protein
MVVTIAIVAIVSTFGFLGITNARAEFRLQSSARQMASYLEKARADAIRRHAGPGEESSVQTFGAGTNTYVVRMDFGSGILESRTYQLEYGVTFNEKAAIVSFDWRGRITEHWVYQLNNGRRVVPVDVSGSGDITIDSQRFPDELIPAVELSAVTGDTIPDPTPSPGGSGETPPNPDESPTPTPVPTPTPNGNGNGSGSGSGNNGNDPHATPTPTPEPTPTPTPGAGDPTPTPTPIPPCTTTLSPTLLKLSQSDSTKHTGTAVFTIANGSGERTLTAVQAGNGNSFVIDLSLVRITGSGSTVISVTAKNGAGNRGVFIINVSASPACGNTQQLEVDVSN